MSLPRYQEYKDTGIPGIGLIPATWELVPLLRLSEFLQTGPFGSQLHSEDYVEGETPVVNPSNILDGRLVPDYSCTVNDSDARRLAQHLLRAGEIVVGRRGEMGRCAVVPPDAAGWLCGTGCLKVRLKPHAVAAFVGTWLRTTYVRATLSLESVGSTMENLNASILGRVPVPLPPHADQLAVVRFLDHETAKIDALVAEQEKLIALLAEKRQATISHAVTRGLDPDVPMQHSDLPFLGEVPAHWSVFPLRRVVLAIEQGWSPECYAREAEANEWGVLKAGCLNGGIFRPTENKALPPELTPDATYEVVVGDVLMSRASGSTDLVGSTAVVTATRPGLMLSDKIFRLRLQDLMTPRYFVSALNSRALRTQIENALSGGNGMANNLPQSNLLAFWIPVPPKVEQEQIADFVESEASKLDSLSAESGRAIALLKERRSALITAAVTGQIDVRHAVPA